MEAVNPKNITEHIDDITFCIANFNIATSDYNAFTPSQLGIPGDESNVIYTKGEINHSSYKIMLGDKAKNCKIFFEEGVQGSGNKISLKNEGNIVYIGKNCSLNKVSMSVLFPGDFILVGKGVSTTSTNIWSTGLNPGKANNGIIVGDHCLFASEVAIRPADGHPIIDIESRAQINISLRPIVIEPYCWIGQRTAILKNVRVGACSIISFGAVVTKSCEKFSVLSGVPAVRRDFEGKMWLRNNGAEAKKNQRHYEARFASKSPTIVETKKPPILTRVNMFCKKATFKVARLWS